LNVGLYSIFTLLFLLLRSLSSPPPMPLITLFAIFFPAELGVPFFATNFAVPLGLLPQFLILSPCKSSPVCRLFFFSGCIARMFSLSTSPLFSSALIWTPLFPPRPPPRRSLHPDGLVVLKSPIDPMNFLLLDSVSSVAELVQVVPSDGLFFSTGSPFIYLHPRLPASQSPMVLSEDSVLFTNCDTPSLALRLKAPSFLPP